jgi:WD40 repeat protein
VKRSVTVALGAIVLVCAALTPMARAATEAEKLAAIQNGLAYLYKTQQAGGYWSLSGSEQAATGAAAFAFLSQQDKWGGNAALYQTAVDNAIAYLVNTADTIDVSTRNDGANICPGGVASCTGVYWYGNADSTHTTGLVAPAIAAYGVTVGANAVAAISGPLAGMTWGQIAQGITNAFAASQSTSGNGNRDGGWCHFIPGNGDSDSSSTQWAVTSFLYDETLGAVTPQLVKDELKVWLGNLQDASGAVCYQPGTEPCNHANTGGWLLAMKFVGYDLANSQLQAALAFLNRHWQSTATNVWYGNFGRPYAMWAVYKGLETNIGLNDTTHIINLLTDCGATTTELPGDPSGSAPCTWSEDYNHWLVKNQKVDGRSGGYSYWTDPLASAFYVNILGAIQIANEPPKSGAPGRALLSPQALAPTALATGGQTGIAVALVTGAPVAQFPISSTKLRPHLRKGVTALAVNAGGSALASASTDNRIRIWNPTNGQQRLMLSGSLGLPTGVAFSPSGGTLSSVGRDSLVRVWDAASGSQLAGLAGHSQAIRAVVVSPDGRFLASAGEESRIMLWDLTNRKLSEILYGSTSFVNALSFSPDSRLLVSGGDDARVLVFDAAAGKVRFILRGHSGGIDTVAFSPDGSVLASGGQDTLIHLWDPISGQQRRVLTGHSAPIRAIIFSPDGQSIASGGEDARIILWNAATGAMNRVLSGSPGMINALAFGPAGTFLASASDTGKITLWNATAGATLLTITVP